MSDPYYNFVQALLPFDGVDGATATTEEGPLGKSVVMSGGASLSSAQSRWGGTSGFTDGVNGFIAIQDGSFAIPDIFSLEFWLYVDAAGSKVVATNKEANSVNGYYLITVESDNALQCQFRNTGGVQYFLTGTASDISVGVWHHVALIKNGNSIEMYLDGVSHSTATVAGNFSTANNDSLRFGSFPFPGFESFSKIWVDDVRYSFGLARYNADFATPTGPYGLFLDESIDPFYDDVVLLLPFEETPGSTVTAGIGPTTEVGTFATATVAGVSSDSQKFGNNAFFDDPSVLTVPHKADFNFLSDDLTVEMWVNRSSSDASDGIVLEKGGQTFTLYYTTVGHLELFVSSTGSSWNLVNGLRIAVNPQRNVWHHVAVVRRGNTWSVLFNGTRANTLTVAGSIASNTNPLSLGGKVGLTNGFNGRLDDVRITRGQARYPLGAYAVPTQAFAASSSLIIGPTFDTNISDQSVGAGNQVTLTVATSGSGAITYQWFRDSVSLPGETGASLTFQAAQNLDGSEYYVEATDSLGTTASATAVLTVTSPAFNLTSVAGSSSIPVGAEFTQAIMTGKGWIADESYNFAARSGDSTEIFQGRNGVSYYLPWAVKAGRTYNMSARMGVAYAFGGLGQVVIYDNPGLTSVRLAGNSVGNPAAYSALSYTAVADETLYFAINHFNMSGTRSMIITDLIMDVGIPAAVPPTIDTEPSNTTASEATTATFTVVASGTAPLTYQWFDAVTDVAVPGETAATFDFTTDISDDGNSYYVVVTNDQGTAQSVDVTLTVTLAAPIIDTQPTDQSVPALEVATFTVAATTSGGALTYQWYDASDDSAITGETSATFTPPTALANSGDQFYAIVTDSNGSRQSNTATLTVTLPAQVVTDDLPLETNSLAARTVVLSASFSNPSTYQWFEVGVGALPGETGSALTLYVDGDDAGRQFYVTATDIYAQQATSSTTTLFIIRISLDDQTSFNDNPATLPEPTPVRRRSQDWASMVAAAEGGQPHYVEEYEFSSRTFRKRDKLLNPKN